MKLLETTAEIMLFYFAPLLGKSSPIYAHYDPSIGHEGVWLLKISNILKSRTALG